MDPRDDLESLTRDELIDIVRDLHEQVRRARLRSAPEPAPAPAPVPPDGADEETLPLTPLRRGLAEHAARSRQSIPHGLAVVEIDMTEVAGLRDRVKVKLQDREGVRITYLPFVLKCAAEALRRYPLLGARWIGDGTVRVPRRFHLGVAVRREGRETVVPVIRDADKKSVVGLARETMDLTARAQSDTLSADEMRGAVLTVTNPGALGALLHAPTIPIPCAAALAIGQVSPAAPDGASRRTMHLTLSYDQRIVDDETALLFLQEIRRSLEETRFLFT